MNTNKIDILCNQIIDVALVSKDAFDTIDNANLTEYPQKFVNRINSVVQYCYNMFMNANAGKHTDDQINELLINLLNNIIFYKNSYHKNSYGYKVMNSLFDIVKDTFIEFN